MTTMNIEDIKKKKFVSSKYTPNSYRIFCEDIGNQSIPDESKYSSQAPQLYTHPLIVPAQAIEDRNRPHAGRAAGFIRENAHTLNEPVNRVGSRHTSGDAEKRWWEWNLPKEEDADWKSKKRSSSMGPAREQSANGEGFQTTYQKEHGYLKNLGSTSGGPHRHAFNPNSAQAVGIVPINDLNAHTSAGEQQRVFVDRMSFEQNYDARKEGNYPHKGKRQGAFVLEQTEPKAAVGTRVRPDSNKGASVWDAMHIDTLPSAPVSSLPPRSGGVRSFVNPEAFRQRRDPIGYFEDNKFGGSMGYELPNANPAVNFNPHLKANTQEPPNETYQPSWMLDQQQQQQQQQMQYNSGELLDNGMSAYQRPMISNGLSG